MGLHGRDYESFTDKKLKELITEHQMQNAYKASCKKTGVAFHNNSGGLLKVAVDYRESGISSEVKATFDKFNCPWETMNLEQGTNDLPYFGEESGFIQLLMWFIQLSLPKLKWELVDRQIPVFNGWWDKNLNVQLGYGLYQ